MTTTPSHHQITTSPHRHFTTSSNQLALCVLFAIIHSITFTTPARAAINLELRPSATSISPGDLINFSLFAISDSSIPPDSHTLAAAQVILNWNPSQLQLLGLITAPPAAPFLASNFGPEPYHFNDSLTDGDAMWLGFAPLGNPITATSTSTGGGTLLTTFRFQAPLNAAPGTAFLSIPLQASHPPIPPNPPWPSGSTIVFDGTIPNFDVTGILTGASVLIVPAPSIGGAMIGYALITRSRKRRLA